MNTVPSPCNDICRMHAGTGFCEGCGRTIDEITAWGQLDDDARLRVWAQLPQRRGDVEVMLFGTASATPAATATAKSTDLDR